MTNLVRIDAYVVHVPLPRPVVLANQTIEARDYVVVEAEDSHGSTGRAIGYTRGAPVDAVVSRMLKPTWLGSDLEDYPATYGKTVRAHGFQGTHGIFWRALSVADIAVHDLLAKRDGVPLAVWLGGSIRPIPTTLAGCYPFVGQTQDQLEALIGRMALLPSTGIKVTSSGDYSLDTLRLKACRKVLGDDHQPLIIDLYNAAGDAESLIPYARQWAEFGMGWLEDPFDFDALDDLAQLANALPYPVGVGDEQAGLNHFDNLMRYGKIGVVRLDASTCGGVTAFLRIARLAESRGVPVSCHVFHHLHAQLASVVPQASIEYMLPETGVDAIDSLIDEDLKWGAKGLLPSARPGIGIVWNEQALHRHRSK
jgi:L-alanine-DL-glutamate epimerase-like enolase superfamily enzyme